VSDLPPEPVTARDDPPGPAAPDTEPPTHEDEAPPAGDPRTRLDAGPAARSEPPPTGAWFLGQPPSRLAGRLTPIRSLSSSGQGHLFLCEAAGGEQVVLKVFYQARPAAQEVWDLWQDAADRHVVRLLEAFTEGEHSYEVTEYLPEGSLADRVRRLPPAGPETGETGGMVRRPLPEAEVETILREVSGALAHIHRDLPKILVHRDVKPGNILVRHRDGPIELCLTDFGLAAAQTQTKDWHSGSRTAAYAAPEAPWGQSSPALDWWSLGMTVLELLQGYHPFVRADGTWLSEPEMSALVASEAIPVDDSVDSRWQELFLGLLARNPDHRWGGDEVGRWLAGDRPPVPPVESGRPFPFAGGLVYTAPELAAAISTHWVEAGSLVVGRQWQDLRVWAARLSGDLDAELDDLERVYVQPGRPVDRTVTELMVCLDRRATPSFQGAVVDRVRLAPLAGSATAGDGDAGEIVTALHASGALRALAGLDGQAELALVDERWQHLGEVARAAAERALGSMDELPAASLLAPMLLGAVLDPDRAGALAVRARRLRDHRTRRVPWFRRLLDSARSAGEDAAAYHAVIVLAAPLAREWQPELTEAARAQLAARLAREPGSPPPAGRLGPPVRRLGPPAGAIAWSVGYLALVAVVGTGVGAGTSPTEGVLVALVLAAAGGTIAVALSRPRGRTTDALLGGWAGAWVGLAAGALAGGVAGHVLGRTVGWPVFWTIWLGVVVVGAALGAAE
jgi:hypothetical protein